MEAISSHYGLALYSIAYDNKKIVDLQQESKVLKEIFEENPDFIMILGSSFLSLDERQNILKDTLKGVDEDLIALLLVVMANNRTSYILDILESFNSYCNEYRGISEGLVYSTLKLDAASIKNIEEKISKIEHQKVELKNIIDPTLIGGVKVVIHDRIYDGSIKHHIEMMKQDLLKKKEDV